MYAIVFPGQGSQRPGMGRDLHTEYETARLVFEEVSDATGVDTIGLCFHTDETTLRRTDRAQLALFTCGIAAWRCLEEASGLEPAAFAGHSVGEYAAVCSAGAIGLADCARLVKQRGQVMAAAGKEVPGTMAAILGMESETLQALCDSVADSGVCVIANDNAPGQLVVSGNVDAVHALSAVAPDKGAKRVIPLSVSGAFHSPLMAGAGREFAVALAAAEFGGTMRAPVFANTTAESVTDSSQWPDLLARQLESAVLWTDSMRAMSAAGVTHWIECGVGEVLCGLVRRIVPEAQVSKVVDSATLDSVVEEVAA